MGQVHWERMGNDASSHIGPETPRFYVVFVPYNSYNFWLWCFKVKVNQEWILLPVVCSVYEEGKKLHSGGQLTGRALLSLCSPPIHHRHSPFSLCFRCSKPKMHLLASKGANTPAQAAPAPPSISLQKKLKLHNVKFTM